MAEKRLITCLVTKKGNQYTLGEDKVAKIAYQGDRHKTVGSSYTECYVVEYTNSTKRTVVPHHAVEFVETDVEPEAAKEDGAAVPELPEE